MNKHLGYLLTFVAGIGAGIGVSYLYFKRTYNIVDDEYYKMLDEKEARQTEDNEMSDDISNDESESFTAKDDKKPFGPFGSFGDTLAKSMEKGGEEEMNGIYLIPPDDLGNTEYEVHSLDYFSDGKVADEEGNIVEHVEDLIGKDALEHFGDYEEDSVFVRNDILAQDFEILKDYRKYVEAYGG